MPRWDGGVRPPAVPWLLGAVALAARLATAAGQPSEWDSVQLVLGVAGFDVRLETPHAPGYWLYVAAGRLVLLGAGARLLDNVGDLQLQQVRAIEAPGVTHIRYRVVKG